MYGVAIYTGQDTKMSMNSKMTGNKFSTVEKSMNKYLIFFMFLLFLEVFLATILKYQVASDRPGDDVTVPWYITFPENNNIEYSFRQVSQDVLSFLVLFNYIIPISLYVTLEMQKFFGSLFLVWDIQLYDEALNQPAKCNSSDLNEELGQVEYLFSDKTGTLTENVMEFKECSIDGIKFHDENSRLLCDDAAHSPSPRKIKRFLETLALCHTVQATKANEKIEDPKLITYSASSPDEKALVEACKKYGVTFIGEKEKDGGRTTLKLLSEERKLKYERMHVLEFDSNRKCMSVIVRDSKGSIRVLTKGAESSIFPKCRAGPIEPTTIHINDYALVGLRTLAIAVKKISAEEYEDFLAKVNEANQAMTDREKKVKAVYTELESNLELIGAIAVEDKLQEDVRETLIRLGQAGIKVWILTGDKKETAINISFACGHFQTGMRMIDVADNDVNTVTNALEAGLTKQRSDSSQVYSLVVDGATLTSIFTYPENLELFQELTNSCAAVICCRMSPLQKAEIVTMIKKSKRNPITAAVGDGANDVSMIQEAHVGLGITGKEGRAAVRAADFAFAKFKHLQRVLLVHGHWYYYRVAMLVQYFFYKNVAGFTAQLYFCFFNDYSTQTLYDSISLTLFNITYTSLPIFVFGLFEQNLSAELLLRRPELYAKNAKNRLLNLKEFSIWFFEAVWHSLVTYFGFYFVWSYYYNITENDYLERTSFGLSVYQSVVVITNFRLLLQSRFWNGFFIFSIFGSMIFYLAFTLAYQGILADPGFANIFLDPNGPTDVGKLPLSYESYWVVYHVMASPSFWFMTLLTLVIALVPDMSIAALRKSKKYLQRYWWDLQRSKARRKNSSYNVQVTRISGSFEMEAPNKHNSYVNRGYLGSIDNFNA